MKIFICLILLLLSSCVQKKEISEEKISFEQMNKTFTKEIKIIETTKTLGEASTKIIDTGKNRMNNIFLACTSVSGKKLLPGEEFSFNKSTGLRSKSRGYKDAPVIFNGEKSYGVGGGVCQVSTTIYMAAKNASLKIMERHIHSEEVLYAPNHTDATVVYGEKDLRFKNNTDDTIYIYTWVEGEKVFSKIIKKDIDIQE